MVFTKQEQRLILRYFNVYGKRLGEFSFLRKFSLEKHNFTFLNGRDFLKAVKGLSPFWIRKEGTKYLLTRDGWDLGTHLFQKEKLTPSIQEHT